MRKRLRQITPDDIYIKEGHWRREWTMHYEAYFDDTTAIGKKNKYSKVSCTKSIRNSQMSSNVYRIFGIDLDVINDNGVWRLVKNVNVCRVLK